MKFSSRVSLNGEFRHFHILIQEQTNFGCLQFSGGSTLLEGWETRSAEWAAAVRNWWLSKCPVSKGFGAVRDFSSSQASKLWNYHHNRAKHGCERLKALRAGERSHSPALWRLFQAGRREQLTCTAWLSHITWASMEAKRMDKVLGRHDLHPTRLPGDISCRFTLTTCYSCALPPFSAKGTELHTNPLQKHFLLPLSWFGC